MKTWREKTKEEWIKTADETISVSMDDVKNHANKWIRRLAPKVLDVYGFYVYAENNNVTVMVLNK